MTIEHSAVGLGAEASQTASSLLKVRVCGPSDGPVWDAFVDRHPDATYCHAFAWSAVLERTYGLQPMFLCLQIGDEWVGVFSAAVLKRVVGLRARAVSLPFCNYGDVLTSPHVDRDAARAACLAFLAQRGVPRVEVRELHGNLQAREITLQLDLPGSEQALWQALDPKVRNQVRKAQRQGLVARWGRDQVDVLYSIYAANMGRLGTPVHSRRFVHEIVRAFGERCDILSVGSDGQPMGAMLLIKTHAGWADPIASTVYAYKERNPGMLMYWEALRTAAENHIPRFDFGRSQLGSGTDRFKRQWGAAPVGLLYRTFEDGRPTARSSTDAYRGRSGHLASDAWKRLPATLQLRLGPLLRQHMP